MIASRQEFRTEPWVPIRQSWVIGSHEAAHNKYALALQSSLPNGIAIRINFPLLGNFIRRRRRRPVGQTNWAINRTEPGRGESEGPGRKTLSIRATVFPHFHISTKRRSWSWSWSRSRHRNSISMKRKTADTNSSQPRAARTRNGNSLRGSLNTDNFRMAEHDVRCPFAVRSLSVVAATQLPKQDWRRGRIAIKYAGVTASIRSLALKQQCWPWCSHRDCDCACACACAGNNYRI